MTTKPEITIFDDNFDCHEKDLTGRIGSAFASYPDLTRWPKEFDWNRDKSKITDLCIFTDRYIEEAHTVNCKYKIAWVLEPKEWDPRPYRYLEVPENRKHFDLILTHELTLLDSITEVPKQFYFPCAGVRVKDEDFKIYDKKKNLTLPMSFKNITSGHKLRHYLHDKYRDSGIMDFYIHGYRLFDALRDYRFSITIENTRGGSLSEKVTTAFLCGTLPIYCGCPRIGEYFDDRGIITFKNPLELHKIIESLNGNFEEIYESKLPYIKTNFEIAKNTYMVDDILWERNFKKYAI